jgi:uncharacterized damage-inducible protein DinB
VKRDAIEELADYTAFAWAMIGQSAHALPAGSLTRPVQLSGWPSLREAFLHVIGASDEWLHATLEYGGAIRPRPEAMAAWEDFDAYHRTTRATFQRILDQTPDAALYRPFTRTYDNDDVPETMSLADILANLLLHERGHHGDLSTLIYQLGGEPPPLDYRQYVYCKRHPESPFRPAGW